MGTLRYWFVRFGAKAPKEGFHNVNHRSDIEEHSRAAQRPSSRGNGLLVKTFYEYTAYRDAVRRHNRNASQRKNGVESDCGADVDQRKYYREESGCDNGGHG